MVCPPTAVARSVRAPFWLTVPPTSVLPARFSTGMRLAGDHRLVDEAAALGHFAIDRHSLAGAYLNEVAQDYLGDRNVHRAALAHDMRHLGLQPDQALDGFGGATLGAGLEKAPQQDQRDDDGRCLVVDVHRTGWQQAGSEGGDQRIAECGSGADGDQRVHVRRQAYQGGETLLIETPAGNDQYQQRQRELQIPALLKADGRHDPLVHAGNHVRAHFKHEHRQRQQRGQDQVALEFGSLGVLLFHILVAGLRGAIDSASLVANLADSGEQILHGHHATHPGPFGRQVHRGFLDAGHGFECPLDTAHAGGAGHARDRQLDGIGGHVVADLFDRLDQRHAIDGARQANVRSFGGQVDGYTVHAFDPGQGRLDSADTAGAGHALDGQTDGCGGTNINCV